LIEAQWPAKYSRAAGFVSAQDEYSLLNRKLDTETYR